MLLEIEESKDLPMAGLLQRRPHVDPEVEVKDRAQNRGTEYRTTMALANAAGGTVRKRPKNEPGRAFAGAHAESVWWVIAPSNATATRP